MRKHFLYLSSAERSEIEILKGKGYGVRAIARVLRRSPNTISRELKKVSSGYRAAYAKIYTRRNLMYRRLQWSKIESIPALKEYIIEKLKLSWNPDEISGRMKNACDAVTPKSRVRTIACPLLIGAPR